MPSPSRREGDNFVILEHSQVGDDKMPWCAAYLAKCLAVPLSWRARLKAAIKRLSGRLALFVGCLVYAVLVLVLPRAVLRRCVNEAVDLLGDCLD